MKTLGTTVGACDVPQTISQETHKHRVTDFKVSLCLVKGFLKNSNIKILTQNQKSTTVLPR